MHDEFKSLKTIANLLKQIKLCKAVYILLGNAFINKANQYSICRKIVIHIYNIHYTYTFSCQKKKLSALGYVFIILVIVFKTFKGNCQIKILFVDFFKKVFTEYIYVYLFEFTKKNSFLLWI